MDKQKQIEEMAKDMVEYGMKKYPTGESIFTETTLRESFYQVFLAYAEYLINKGYCKITESAVVLTREQYEKDLAIERELGERKASRASKETVEKFAERLKEKFAYDVERCKAVDEIAKGFTGEKS